MQCLQIRLPPPIPHPHLNAKFISLKSRSSLTSCPPPSPCRQQTGNSSHRMTSPSLPSWPSATSASNRNNISNTSLCFAKAQGKCRHTQVKEIQLCVICATRPQKVVICATRPQKVVICATRPQKVPRFVTTPNKLQRLILILFSFLFFCCGFCCCLGFCCCCCGGKGGVVFVCVWSFFFFCLVYLANIYATKC